MAIPNVWPDRRAKRVCRALANIAAERIAPAAAVRRNDFLRGEIEIGGQVRPCVLDVRCSTNAPNHHIRLPASVCRELATEADRHPTHFVGLLALHRVPSDDARQLNRWNIPASVVTQMHERLPSETGDEPNLRNVDIRRDGNRWLWYAPADRAISIDITAHYEPWELSDEELQHIADGNAGLYDEPAPVPPRGAGDHDAINIPPAPPPRDDEAVGVPPIIGRNRIYFGPPGTGKSRRISDLLDQDNLVGQVQRVTFHPEYAYSDFVGAYRPVTVYSGDEQYHDLMGRDLPIVGRPAVVYRYVPGPLIRMVEAALRDPEHPYFLVIEEINRGNCAAIFGDLFQLLDRGGDDGSSEYEVRAEADLMHHLEAATRLDDAAPETVRINYRRLTDRGLFIPANLSLLATMNTSDQSLYPMDAAMKRRWEMIYVPIDYTAARQRTVDLPAYGVRNWAETLQGLNRRIVERTQTDDKQVGQWFVPGRPGDTIARDTFRDKVLSYLWFDVFRHNPRDLFDLGDEPYAYEALMGRYDRNEPVFAAGVLDVPVAAPQANVPGEPGEAANGG
ncbi:MAG TPA: AAA family ATPase [Tepidisphaeraceae bacterium]|jgi:hypothetical protein